MYLAKDNFYPSFNGKVSNFKLLLCGGAYDPSYPVDPKPPDTPLPPPEPEPLPTCVEGSSAIADAAADKPAVADIKVGDADVKGARDYGYGYWLRFLTRHPTTLL